MFLAPAVKKRKPRFKAETKADVKQDIKSENMAEDEKKQQGEQLRGDDMDATSDVGGFGSKDETKKRHQLSEAEDNSVTKRHKAVVDEVLSGGEVEADAGNQDNEDHKDDRN